MSTAQHMKLRTRNTLVSTLLAVVLILGGVGFIAYPHLSGWLNRSQQRHDLTTYQQTVERMDAAQVERQLQQAADYNRGTRSSVGDALMVEEGDVAYERLLDPAGTGMMGYVDVPSLGIRVPLYHGISDAVLKNGAGHVPMTSLPVGGPSTHAAVSAHRGEPGADYFKDLDRLAEGDKFSVTVYDRTLTYEVDQIKVVEPTDGHDLAVVPGEDLFTLVTCTPYGVNSHRLLVRGHRVG